MAEKPWRIFEREIQDIFSRIPGVKIRRDAVIVGKSGRRRKFELFVRYPLKIKFARDFVAKVPIKIAVECKDHKRRIDIDLVGRFADQMDDVGAPVGIMVATRGFDAGARARAKLKNIYLIDAPWDLIALAKGLKVPELYLCRECEEQVGDDEAPGFVFWELLSDRHDVVWGTCNRCNSLHAVCPDCGAISGFLSDSDVGDVIECEGGCGRVYMPESDSVESSAENDSLGAVELEILQTTQKTKGGRIGLDQVRKILDASKWKYHTDKFGLLRKLEARDWVFVDWQPGEKDTKVRLSEQAEAFLEDELPQSRGAHYGW